MRGHGMGLCIEMADYAPGCEEEVRAWLDGDHVARMLEAPGMRGAACYEAVRGEPRFLNLYEAESVHVFYGEPFLSLAAASRERNREMEAKRTASVRLLCAQVYPALAPEPPFLPTAEAAGLAPAVQLGRIFVPPENVPDFHAWYAQERAPDIEKVPGVRRIRRFLPVEGDPLMIVLYEMEDESVPGGPAWKEATATPWSGRVRSYYRQEPGSPGVYRRRGLAR